MAIKLRRGAAVSKVVLTATYQLILICIALQQCVLQVNAKLSTPIHHRITNHHCCIHSIAGCAVDAGEKGLNKPKLVEALWGGTRTTKYTKPTQAEGLCKEYIAHHLPTIWDGTLQIQTIDATHWMIPTMCAFLLKSTPNTMELKDSLHRHYPSLTSPKCITRYQSCISAAQPKLKAIRTAHTVGYGQLLPRRITLSPRYAHGIPTNTLENASVAAYATNRYVKQLKSKTLASAMLQQVYPSQLDFKSLKKLLIPTQGSMFLMYPKAAVILSNRVDKWIGRILGMISQLWMEQKTSIMASSIVGLYILGRILKLQWEASAERMRVQAALKDYYAHRQSFIDHGIDYDAEEYLEKNKF